ncbi:MAG: pyruvate formate lyase family protein, partial [Planctomycetota bacterium]
MDRLRRELADYYDTLGNARHGYDISPRLQQNTRPIREAMDRWVEANPGAPAAKRKAVLHETIAERFEPVLFPHSPFFYEMGLRPAQNWGNPNGGSVGSWETERFGHLCNDTDAMHTVRQLHAYNPTLPWHLWQVNGPFDIDHHCLGYTGLMAEGVQGLIDKIDRRVAAGGVDDSQATWLDASRRGLTALVKVAERFGQAAERAADTAPDEQSRRFMLMIRETTRRVPAHPPRTFYEGLSMLWFVREAVATLEGIGISVIGHLDRLLIDLYRADLAEGRLTEDEAADLLARYMLPTDVKFFLEENAWPETSTCMELGGCDAEGRPLYNELTRLIVETHVRHGLVNPKLNCRVAADSPREYLEQMGRHILSGHNVFALLNDEVLIPANVRSGKTVEEARLYVNGGCQETMVEGVEHSAGAYYYFNMPRVLDLCLRGEPVPPGVEVSDEVVQLLPKPMPKPTDFETCYRYVMDELKRTIGMGANLLRRGASRWPEVHPCPVFSSTLVDCIERGTDYTAGGARYNPAGIALVGLGTVADSLAAIKHAVFDGGFVSWPELMHLLETDWVGCEAVRTRMVSLPKFGHGDPEVDQLAARVAKELGEFCRGLTNERGGPYQASFFVYYQFKKMGVQVRATPDG